MLEAGRGVLAQVASDCRTWVRHGFRPPAVAVNVSPIRLQHKDFVETVLGAAAEARSVSGQIELEITESVLMDRFEESAHKLEVLRKSGVGVSVDDFGTGYFKIDRSFATRMIESQENLALVRSIISLSHSLKLDVIAEGVETGRQALKLQELDCDQLQGCLFGRPTPAIEVPALVSRPAIASAG